GEPLTDQARQVRGHGLNSHGPKVDQAGEPVGYEEEVLRADIAQARLERDLQPCCVAERGQEPGNGRPGQESPALAQYRLRVSLRALQGGYHEVETAFGQFLEVANPQAKAGTGSALPMAGEPPVNRGQSRERRLDASRRRRTLERGSAG